MPERCLTDSHHDQASGSTPTTGTKKTSMTSVLTSGLSRLCSCLCSPLVIAPVQCSRRMQQQQQ